MKDSLPIYRLEPQDTSVKRLAMLGQQIFGLHDEFRLSETRDGKVLRNAHHVVEIANASGAVWAADESQMWRPSVNAELPGDADALSIANDFLQREGLLPALHAPFSYGKPVIGGTHFALRKDGKRQNRRLDVQVVYPVMVDKIPVVGGGSDLTVTLGHKGSVIGFNGGWRTAVAEFDAKMIAPEKVKEQFHGLMKPDEARILRHVARLLRSAVVHRAGVPLSGVRVPRHGRVRQTARAASAGHARRHRFRSTGAPSASRKRNGANRPGPLRCRKKKPRPKLPANCAGRLPPQP